MIKVIINADDCGYSPDVNAAIDYALSRKVISSTTIMANANYLEEVHKMVERHPEASFGIHLNMTEGLSLTKSPVFREKGITDGKDCFISGNSQRCPLPDNQLAKAIYDEWDAQMDLLIKKEGFSISHVDGHHHCHTWMGLQDILVKLMRKYGIKRVRNKYYTPVGSSIIGLKEKLIQLIEPIGKRMPQLQEKVHYYTFNKALNRNYIKTTDYFGAYEYLSPILNQKGLLGQLQGKTIELMCHPGLLGYQKEYDLVLHNTLGIDNSKYSLISYKEL